MLKTTRDSENASPSSWRARRQRTRLVTAALAAAAGAVAAGATWWAVGQLPAAAPWVVGAGAAALLGLMAAGPRLQLAARPAALLGLALLGLTLASGFRLAAAVPATQTTSAQPDPNALVVARVKRITEELRELKTIPGGRTPARGQLLAYLRDLPEGEAMLANPFGGPPQTTTRLLPAQGSPLPGAAALAAGKEPPILGLPLGPGEPASPGKPYSLRTWGALIFDHDPVSGEYVLYGIGRQGDQAVLVHQSRGWR